MQVKCSHCKVTLKRYVYLVKDAPLCRSCGQFYGKVTSLGWVKAEKDIWAESKTPEERGFGKNGR